MKLCKRNGTDITFATELNTFSNGIKRFEIDGESMYFLHSTKTGVLMRGKWYRKWETEGRKWSGVAPGIFRRGADSSDEGAKI